MNKMRATSPEMEILSCAVVVDPSPEAAPDAISPEAFPQLVATAAGALALRDKRILVITNEPQEVTASLQAGLAAAGSDIRAQEFTALMHHNQNRPETITAFNNGDISVFVAGGLARYVHGLRPDVLILARPTTDAHTLDRLFRAVNNPAEVVEIIPRAAAESRQLKFFWQLLGRSRVQQATGPGLNGGMFEAELAARFAACDGQTRRQVLGLPSLDASKPGEKLATDLAVEASMDYHAAYKDLRDAGITLTSRLVGGKSRLVVAENELARAREVLKRELALTKIPVMSIADRLQCNSESVNNQAKVGGFISERQPVGRGPEMAVLTWEALRYLEAHLDRIRYAKLADNAVRIAWDRLPVPGQPITDEQKRYAEALHRLLVNPKRIPALIKRLSEGDARRYADTVYANWLTELEQTDYFGIE